MPGKFDKVPINSNDPNPCSPSPPPDSLWRGILIDAPEEVSYQAGKTVDEYGAFARIPICGYSLMDVPTEPCREHIQLFAVDIANGEIYSGEVYDLDPSPSKPPPDDSPFSPEELKGVAVGSYFNPNLANFVQIPVQDATYEVYAEFRDMRSNTRKIRIFEEMKHE